MDVFRILVAAMAMFVGADPDAGVPADPFPVRAIPIPGTRLAASETPDAGTTSTADASAAAPATNPSFVERGAPDAGAAAGGAVSDVPAQVRSLPNIFDLAPWLLEDPTKSVSGYLGARWGMTPEQVAAEFPGALTPKEFAAQLPGHDDRRKMATYTTIADKRASIEFVFDDRLRLGMVAVDFFFNSEGTDRDNSKAAHLFYDSLKRAIVDKYGPPDKSSGRKPESKWTRKPTRIRASLDDPWVRIAYFDMDRLNDLWQLEMRSMTADASQPSLRDVFAAKWGDTRADIIKKFPKAKKVGRGHLEILTYGGGGPLVSVRFGYCHGESGLCWVQADISQGGSVTTEQLREDVTLSIIAKYGIYAHMYDEYTIWNFGSSNSSRITVDPCRGDVCKSFASVTVTYKHDCNMDVLREARANPDLVKPFKAQPPPLNFDRL